MNRYSFNKKDHIHTLDGKPLIGTTTALSVIEKPLTWWASGMACAEFGWINPKKHTKEEVMAAAEKGLDNIKGCFMNERSGHKYADWVKFLDKAYRAHNTKKEKAATEGIDLHELIETYIKSKIASIKISIDPLIESFVSWTDKNVKRFLFSEIHCYSERLWCGGIVDFAYEDMGGNFVLADVKSSREAYFSHMVQMGSYDIQLTENGGFDAKGTKTFTLDKPFKAHAIFHFGGGFTEPTISFNVQGNRDSFVNALGLYKNRQAFEENT